MASFCARPATAQTSTWCRSGASFAIVSSRQTCASLLIRSTALARPGTERIVRAFCTDQETPYATCQQGLFELLRSAPQKRDIHVPNLQLVPHVNTSIRHYATIWAERRQALGQPVAPSDMRFLHHSVLPLLTGITVSHLAHDTTILPALFAHIRRVMGEAPARRAYRLMSQMGAAMTSDHLTPWNPCRNTLAPVQTGPNMRMLTPEQREAIRLHSLTNPSLVPVGLIMETGIAIDEACVLQAQDLDLAGSQLRIRSPPTSKRFPRTIPLSNSAVRLLQTMERGTSHGPSPLLTNKRGQAYTPATLRGRFATMRGLLGLERLGPRTLLSDFIAYAVLHHIDPIQLKDYLGLKKPGMVLDVWQSLPRI